VPTEDPLGAHCVRLPRADGSGRAANGFAQRIGCIAAISPARETTLARRLLSMY